MVSVVFAFYRLLHVKNCVNFTKLETKQISIAGMNAGFKMKCKNNLPPTKTSPKVRF